MWQLQYQAIRYGVLPFPDSSIDLDSETRQEPMNILTWKHHEYCSTRRVIWVLFSFSFMPIHLLFAMRKWLIEPGLGTMCLIPYANNKGADQPAHPRSLISTFVFRCLDSMICILALSKVSRFQLVSVAEQAGLNLTWSKIPEDTFSRDAAQLELQMVGNPIEI